MLHENYEVTGDIKARDWVAVMAMQGILAGGKSGHETGRQSTINEVAKQAYAVADSMLSQSLMEQVPLK